MMIFKYGNEFLFISSSLPRVGPENLSTRIIHSTAIRGFSRAGGGA